MDEGEQLPLTVDFHLAAQGKAVESLVVPDVAEHRFDSGEALAVLLEKARKLPSGDIVRECSLTIVAPEIAIANWYGIPAKGN